MLADTANIPAEMLFASGSGIDPHISPKSAYQQVARIALARNFNEEQKKVLLSLIEKSTEKPQFYLFEKRELMF